MIKETKVVMVYTCICICMKSIIGVVSVGVYVGTSCIAVPKNKSYNERDTFMYV